MDAANVWSYTFAAIEITVSLLGSLLNGLVILTIYRNIRRISISTLFILSIAVSDFLSCTVGVPFSIANNLQNAWPFGVAGCQAHAFVVFLLGIVSITHLSVIAAEKYLTISKSLTKDSYFDKKHVIVIISTLWIYSLVFSLPPLVGWSEYGLEGTNATCSIQWNSPHAADRAYFGIVFFACYFLPIAIIIFSYYKINALAKQVVGKTMKINGGTMTMNQALVRKQHRSAMNFLAVIISILLSWTPYAVVSFMTVLGMNLNPLSTSAPSVFAKMSFFLNPILYALVSPKFRRWVALAIPIIKQNRAVGPCSK